jgi:hypothetical protein
MPDPLPSPPVPGTPGLAPSNSTNATAAAGALATLVIYVASLKGITFPAGIESALAVVFATLGGYLPKSGRK